MEDLLNPEKMFVILSCAGCLCFALSIPFPSYEKQLIFISTLLLAGSILVVGLNH